MTFFWGGGSKYVTFCNTSCRNRQQVEYELQTDRRHTDAMFVSFDSVRQIELDG